MENEIQVIETVKEENNELVTFLSKTTLAQTKRDNIIKSLGSFFNKAKEWDSTIASIVINDPSETGKMKMAKEGRLTLKSLRLECMRVVGVERELVKSRMADDVLEDKLLLKTGQMAEAMYENLESKLLEKEKFAERWEAENKAKLRLSRDAEVLPYKEFVFGDMDLSNLKQEEYEKFLAGLKIQMQNKIEREEKERAEKEAKAKAEQEERDRIALENTKLKAQAIEAERKAKADKEEADRKLKELQALKEAEMAEEKAKADAEAKRAREVAEEKLKAEKEAQAKILAEQKAKADEEIKKAKRIAEQDKAFAEVEAKRLKVQSDAKAKELADAKAVADAENAKLKAEKAKADAEAKAVKDKEEAEAKAKADEEKELAKNALMHDRMKLVQIGTDIKVRHNLLTNGICLTEKGKEIENVLASQILSILDGLKEKLKELK